MKEKETVIISDDSDDEIRTLYSVNKDGVVLISDDDNVKNTPVQSSENTNVSVIENTRLSCSKEPSTSKENSSSTRKPSSPGRQVSCTRQNKVLPDQNVAKESQPLYQTNKHRYERKKQYFHPALLYL